LFSVRFDNSQISNVISPGAASAMPLVSKESFPIPTVGGDTLMTMTSTNDLDLLGEFTRDHSQDAFAALVQRHLNLVYCAGLRQVRSPQLAEEVAQSVFTDLACNAARLKPDTILTAWLYEVTRRTAINVVRGEARRQSREQIGLEMNAMNATADDWMQIEPLLDEAMHALDDTDRTAVLLRFFENKSLREVGDSLGTTDDTARKRVNRAIEHLREFFAKRGVTVGASGLVGVISANAVQAAPIALAVKISTAATLAAATTATLTHATAITMSWINAKAAAAIVGAAIVAGTGTYIVQEQKLGRAESQQRTLLAQQTQITPERDEALAMAQARLRAEENLRKDLSDLPLLRNEITQLRQQLVAEKQRLAAQPVAPAATPPVANAAPIPAGQYITKDQLAFAGYATPEAAFQSIMWNMVVAGDYDRMLLAETPEERAAKMNDPKDREQFEAAHKMAVPRFKGMQMLARKTLFEDRVELKVKLDSDPYPDRKRASGIVTQTMVKMGEEWKSTGMTVEHDRTWDRSGNIQKFTP
jgi:RNA polymerase sigma factor (sigma-70 family)